MLNADHTPAQRWRAYRHAALLVAGIGVAVIVTVGVTPAAAKHIYQYRDANGIRHFTDRPPTETTISDLKTSLIRTEHQDIVELISEDAESARNLIFQNRWRGPVAVAIVFDQALNIASDPPLPLQVVLNALERRQVARLAPADRRQASSYALSYRAVPGDPSAHHDDAVRYALPFAAAVNYRLAQGPNGQFSHTDPQSRYAYDLAVAEGTEVRAARAGVVMQVERDFFGAGLDRQRYGDRANSVRVLHSDGSMAVYAHLQLESSLVTPGQKVSVGQVLARSGNTGFSSGPHLHFVVQVNRAMELVAVPIEFVATVAAVRPGL